MKTAKFSQLRMTLLILLLLGLALAPAAVAAGNAMGSMERLPEADETAKIDPVLMDDFRDDGIASFFVVLTEQADLEQAYLLPSKEAKGHYVYEALSSTAQRTQADLLAMLDSRRVPHRSLIIINALVVEGDQALAQELAAREEVAVLAANPQVRQVHPVPEANGPVGSLEAVEWGVVDVRADDVWAQYGVTGSGVVVAGQDTGIRWDHAALQSSYRGWNGGTADHNYNWWDAIHADDIYNWSCLNSCGCDSATPCDDHNHGTHTVGTMIGDDGGSNQIGVAPGAQFVGCRNMHSGDGRPGTYVECFEFFLAPWDLSGLNPNPDLAPHVINNSWGCPPSEGCSQATWGVIQLAEQNLRAAGVLIAASAGNSGPACGSIDDPPAMFGESFAVGSYNSSHAIAGSSSRGPRAFTGLQGPDVSAPGVLVRSALRNGSYGIMSGTSMAGPHVAGVTALLWSAVPALIGHVDATEAYLRETANYDVGNASCGTGANTAPWNTWDNVYGWGRIDALAAVQAAMCPVDVDYDRQVTVADIELVAGQWGSSRGLAGYNPRRDLNFDQAIDVLDIVRVADAWSTSCDVEDPGHAAY